MQAGGVREDAVGEGAGGMGAREGGASARGVDEHAPAFRGAAAGRARGTELGRAEGVGGVEDSQVAQGAGVLFRRGGTGAGAEPGAQDGEGLGGDGAGQGGAGGGAEQGGEEEGEGGQDGIERVGFRARFSDRHQGGSGRRSGAGPVFVHDLFLRRWR